MRIYSTSREGRWRVLGWILLLLRGRCAGESRLRRVGCSGGGGGRLQHTTKSINTSSENLTHKHDPEAKFKVPDWGDKVNSGIGLSYRPARLHRLVHSGPVRQPYDGVDFISPVMDLSIRLLDHPKRAETGLNCGTAHLQKCRSILIAGKKCRRVIYRFPGPDR
jgi:hypothetical protein